MEFGADQVFHDVDTLGPWVKFAERIADALDQCEAMLALIGPGRLDVADEKGKRRLDKENDFVRIEIAAALERDIHVYPLLLDGASQPDKEDLPDPLKGLADWQTLTLSNERWDYDIGKLVTALRQLDEEVANGAKPDEEVRAPVEVRTAEPAPPGRRAPPAGGTAGDRTGPPVTASPEPVADPLHAADAAGEAGAHVECLRLGEEALGLAEAGGDEVAIAVAGTAHARWLAEFRRSTRAADLSAAVGDPAERELGARSTSRPSAPAQQRPSRRWFWRRPANGPPRTRRSWSSAASRPWGRAIPRRFGQDRARRPRLAIGDEIAGRADGELVVGDAIRALGSESPELVRMRLRWAWARYVRGATPGDCAEAASAALADSDLGGEHYLEMYARGIAASARRAAKAMPMTPRAWSLPRSEASAEGCACRASPA